MVQYYTVGVANKSAGLGAFALAPTLSRVCRFEAVLSLVANNSHMHTQLFTGRAPSHLDCATAGEISQYAVRSGDSERHRDRVPYGRTPAPHLSGNRVYRAGVQVNPKAYPLSAFLASRRSMGDTSGVPAGGDEMRVPSPTIGRSPRHSPSCSSRACSQRPHLFVTQLMEAGVELAADSL